MARRQGGVGGAGRAALPWLVAVAMEVVMAGCPFADLGGICSGHGACGNQGDCQCVGGWDGYDCGRQVCPNGPVWEYEKLAHYECSKRGHCLLGQCACHTSFSGKACERMACQENCMKRGRCIDVETFYRDMGFPPYTAWDKNMLQGCNCEQPRNGAGYGGLDCMLFECPRGDDPMTTGQVNDVQLIKCNAPSGQFGLRFPFSERGAAIQHNMGLVALKVAVMGLGVREVNVTFSAGTTVCNAVEENIISVTFLQDFGKMEPMQADVSELPDDGKSEVKIAVGGIPLSALSSVTGTKENLPCSRRGLCDQLTGDCACYVIPMPGYRSSDGYGNPGDRGDCGSADDHKFLGNNGTAANGWKSGPIACPGEIPCSGHGICLQLPSKTCSCSAGWGSGDCSQRECPKGWPWFPTEYYSMVTVSNLQKRQQPPSEPCSNRGLCDLSKGECTCQFGFTGAACQIVELCPSESAYPCSGHGTCQSAKQQFLDAGKTEAMFESKWAAMASSHDAWLRYRYGNNWYSCVCEEGYTGYDCATRTWRLAHLFARALCRRHPPGPNTHTPPPPPARRLFSQARAHMATTRMAPACGRCSCSSASRPRDLSTCSTAWRTPPRSVPSRTPRR